MFVANAVSKKIPFARKKKPVTYNFGTGLGRLSDNGDPAATDSTGYNPPVDATIEPAPSFAPTSYYDMGAKAPLVSYSPAPAAPAANPSASGTDYLTAFSNFASQVAQNVPLYKAQYAAVTTGQPVPVRTPILTKTSPLSAGSSKTLMVAAAGLAALLFLPKMLKRR